MASTRPKVYDFTFMNETTLHVDNVMTQAVSIETDTSSVILSLRQGVIPGEVIGREVNVNLANVKYYTVIGPTNGSR